MSLNISVDPVEVLRFQQIRILKNLIRQYLETLEYVEAEHDIALGKLHDLLPDQYKPYVELADYLDEEQARLLRKRVHDHGGDALRALEEIIKQFNITLK